MQIMPGALMKEQGLNWFHYADKGADNTVILFQIPCTVKVRINSSLPSPNPTNSVGREIGQLFSHHSICQRGIRTEIIEGESINYLPTIGYSETRSTRLDREREGRKGRLSSNCLLGKIG